MRKSTNLLKSLFLCGFVLTFSACNSGTDPIDQVGGESNSTTPSQPAPATPPAPTSSKIPENQIVLVQGGTFNMGTTPGSKEDRVGNGSGNAKPQHKVTLSNYKITKFEITFKQFAQFLTEKGNQIENGRKWYSPDNANFSDFDVNGTTFTPKRGLENRPVRFVSWEGAKAFASWAGGRLPTEAEWEYAAKGGRNSKGYIYSGSDNINDVAWYVGNSGGRMHDVGEKKANELGLYDMSGNVWEWTADWYAPYTKEGKVNPKGGTKATMRVRRGASAFCEIDRPKSIYRSTSTKGPVRHNMGFRVAFDVK